MTKDEQIKSLIEELLPLLDLGGKNRLIGFLEGLKFNLSLDKSENVQ